MNANNNGRMLEYTNDPGQRVLQKRAPAEIGGATSLQSLLSHHKIDTNVLKTRAQIAQPQPRPLTAQILTPTSGASGYYRRPQPPIGQKNSGAHQLANLQAISSPLCRLDQHCHPLTLAVVRSLHQFCIILNSVIVQKENFPTQQTWCLNIFPFTFLLRLSDKRNVVGSNWKCPFENFHFES